MKTRDGWRGSCVLALALFTVAGPAPGRAATRRQLTRSLYIPVSFTLCPHLTTAVLFMGQSAVAMLPAERIFQFTYYPELKRIEPEVAQIRVEGAYLEGSQPFLARLAVTPEGIYTATHQVRLDMSKQIQKLRYKIDVRYEKVHLRILCEAACSRGGETRLARSEAVPASAPPRP